MQHAHGHLIVHRDLKASNILVDDDGRPRILDFGIAKLLDPDVDRRLTDVLGRGPLTLACASPEQVRGGPVSTASDVYSLGVLLYRLTTGGSPYEGGDEDDELEHRVLRDPPVPPGERARRTGAPDVPRDLSKVILAALEKDPAERYATPLHLADDLRRFLDHRPVRAGRTSPAAALAKLIRRHPVGAALLAAVLFALIGNWVGTRRSLARVEASESIAWRAHRDAVYAFEQMTDVVLQLGARGLVGEPELEQLLADTERRVNEELSDAPEAEGRLRQALARVYLELGRDERATAHAARAVELARDTRGLGWRDLERGLGLLADLAVRADDPAAVAYSRERLELVEEVLGADAPEAAEARARLESARATVGR